MPLPPYEWGTSEYITATLLNGELYRTNGQPYRGNGIGWHIQRPVFRTWPTYDVTQPTSDGNWQTQYFTPSETVGNAGWISINTGAYFGGRLFLEEEANGAWNGTSLYQGGGADGSPGGIGLMTVCQPVNLAAAGDFAGVGIGQSAGSVASCGGLQGMPSAGQGTTPYHVDFVDLGLGQACGYYVASSTSDQPYSQGWSGGPTTDVADSSGTSARQAGFWASVYPANGNTVSAVPSPTWPWAIGSQVTQADLQQSIQYPMDLLNMPPMLRVEDTSAPSVASNTWTQVCVNQAFTYDSYSGAWDQATGTYTVPLTGAYLVYGCTPYPLATGTTGSGQARCAVVINGTYFYGPSQVWNTPFTSAQKVHIMDLEAGDTVQFYAYQTSGNTQQFSSTAPYCPMFLMLYMGQLGDPPNGYAPVDLTPPYSDYLYTAGTPGLNLPAIFNSYLANSLTFLLWRPAYLSYSTDSQGLSEGTATGVNMEVEEGVVHGTPGDAYDGGGNSGLYTSRASGWYLAVQETLLDVSTATAPYMWSGFQVTPGGYSATDNYQTAEGLASAGGWGAAAVGIYYLYYGDNIQPFTAYFNSSGIGIDTQYVSAGNTSHFELIYLGNG